MFKPADVVRFHSIVANKKKYHLCLNLNGKFLLINSPKSKIFRGDFVVSCSEIDCLPPTESGKSVISCSLLISMTDAELKHLKAERLTRNGTGTDSSAYSLRWGRRPDGAVG